MVKSFAFLTLLALFAALPSTFSAKIPEVGGTSASAQTYARTASAVNGPGSLEPMPTPYMMVDIEPMEKRAADATETQSDSVAASRAQTTRTRPHYTSFLTARADGMPQAQASAVNTKGAAENTAPGSTHAQYTTFFGARSDSTDSSQSGGNGQVAKGGADEHSQGGAHDSQYSGLMKESGSGSQDGGEEELEYCDDSQGEGEDEDDK